MEWGDTFALLEMSSTLRDPDPSFAGPPAVVRVIRQRVVGSDLRPADEDFLAIEDPLEVVLRVAGREERSLVTMRTPGHDRELVAGLLFSDGLLEQSEELLAIEFADEAPPAAARRAIVELSPACAPRLARIDRGPVVASSCGVCGKASLAQLRLSGELPIDDPVRFDGGGVHAFPARMAEAQATFRRTGGLHAAAILDAKGAVGLVREDVGRHNAVDKLIGALLLAGQLPVRGAALLVSGRMSYEVFQKALRARFALLAGVGAPSSLAVALANDFGMTLLGFLREGRYNIYSNPERLVFPGPLS